MKIEVDIEPEIKEYYKQLIQENETVAKMLRKLVGETIPAMIRSRGRQTWKRLFGKMWVALDECAFDAGQFFHETECTAETIGYKVLNAIEKETEKGAK